MKDNTIPPAFAALEFVGEGGNKTTVLSGAEWKQHLWGCINHLERAVPAGHAELSCAYNGEGFNLKIRLMPDTERANIECNLEFQTLDESAEAAETFTWQTREQGGHTWYQTRSSENSYEVWKTVMGEGDIAEVSTDKKEGRFNMERDISLCWGNSFTLRNSRYDNGDNKQAVRTFAEAAAIAVTMPSFLAVLGARQ